MTIDEKLEKTRKEIKEKFGVDVNIFKAGGRWTVNAKNSIDNNKMKEIRSCMNNLFKELEKLEEDDET